MPTIPITAELLQTLITASYEAEAICTYDAEQADDDEEAAGHRRRAEDYARAPREAIALLPA